MTYLRLLLSLLLLASANFLFAATIKGRVTDEKGRPLSYATVFLQGTTSGTNTNGDGVYELTVDAGSYKLVCQYIGYSQSVHPFSIAASETQVHDFKLGAQHLEMKEVVVKSGAEDPAYAIIRKAIKHRKEHLNQITSFHSNIYLKGVLRSRDTMPSKVAGLKVNAKDAGVADSTGKGVLYLLEEDAEFYMQNGKEKTIIHSVRQSGDPRSLGFSRFPSVINFYSNTVNAGDGGRGFISPINDNAFFYYKYKFLGNVMENGHMINIIQLTPKRSYEQCFNGTIYIADDDYAFQGIDVFVSKKSGLKTFDTMRYNQLYIPTKDNAWVIKSQVVYLALKIFMFDITGNFVTVYNGQEVNAKFNDSLFAGNVVSTYDSSANKKDTSYWATARPIPLEKDEVKDYTYKDSIRKVEEDPNRLDSLRKRGNKFAPGGFLISGYTYTGKEKKTRISTNSLLLGIGTNNMLNYNIVEGYNIAPKIDYYRKLDSFSSLNISTIMRYGFTNTHFNAAVRGYYRKNDKGWFGKYWLIGAEGGKYVYQYNADNPVLQWFNTYSTLLYRQSDLKIHERWDASVFARKNYGNGFMWFAKASWQERLPLQNTTTYSWIKGEESGMKPNVPTSLLAVANEWVKHDALILTAIVSYKPGAKYVQYPDYKRSISSKWPRFTLTYNKGVPNIFNSKTDFDKWRFMVSDELSLGLVGSLSYNVGIGGFLNNKYISIPDLMHLYGNRGVGFASPYLNSFQFAQYYLYSNEKRFYKEAHLEYHLDGFITNKIPLIKQLQWHLVTGANAYYADENNYHAEAFVGFENIGWKILRIMRLDFVQSWDNFKGCNSGLRFGFNLFNTPNVNLTNSEW